MTPVRKDRRQREAAVCGPHRGSEWPLQGVAGRPREIYKHALVARDTLDFSIFSLVCFCFLGQVQQLILVLPVLALGSCLLAIPKALRLLSMLQEAPKGVAPSKIARHSRISGSHTTSDGSSLAPTIPSPA